MSEDDIAKNASISLKPSVTNWIEKYRVGKGYKNRSDYVQNLIDRDAFGKTNFLVDLIAYVIFPMICFLFFTVLSVLTKGTLFFLFMGISGIFAVWFSMDYYRRNRIRR